ncbi:DNA polymerase-3 subunit gamma/tau [Aquabacterium commune]|uniref:DNA polymerase III subunit gamma/tau n=2 Tax=Aquabacterium commune TaxID=70586 RepID=A0A4V3CVF7_9BURK|nr:DNA polymerase-3 subunit gamma/tau [Aquabacterium commune]
MVGQGHVVQALSNALTQQRLHHAYLFTGTRGVGKTTVSRILAKSLNCTGPDGQGGITATPCGQCQPCRDIDAGRFVDYVELDAASNRGVDEISQLLEQAVYKPVVGRFKVYMIDEVHMLSNTAFNAMLKTLEEPPDYLKFVLATTDPQKVPVTVLSRCLQFNLRPMAAQTVQLHLAQVLDHEGIAHDPGALRLLARAARGSMRDAMSLADQAIAFGGGALQEDAVRRMLGSVDRQHVQRIIEAVAAGDGAGLVAAVDALRELGLSASGTLEDLAAGLQRMAVVQAVPAMAQAVDETDPDAQTWTQLAPLLAQDETQLFYSLCLQGRAELALAPDEYSGLLMLLLRLLAFKPGGGAGASPKSEGSAARPTAAEPRSVVTGGPQAGQLARAAASQPRPPEPPSTPAAIVAASSPATRAALPPTAAPVVQPSVPPVASAVPSAVARDVRPASAPWDDAPPEHLDAPPDMGNEASVSSGTKHVEAWENGPPPGFDDGWGDGADAAPEAFTSSENASTAAAVAGAGTASASASASAPPMPLSRQLAELPPDPLSDRWAELVAQMQAQGLITALVRELAVQSQCVAQRQEGALSIWHLQVPRASLCGDMHKDRLTQALAQVLGCEVQLHVAQGAAVNTPAQRDLAAREARQHAAEALIEGDALVRGLLAQYPGARIVPGSVVPI